MLKSLTLEDFTVFQAAEFEFGKHLNIIVGENGSGKSHVLKAAYSAIAACATRSAGDTESVSASQIQSILGSKFLSVFRPDSLGGLVRRQRGSGKCSLRFAFDDPSHNLAFAFSTLAPSDATLHQPPTRRIDKLPVFLPTRELLTIYPGFVSLYETTHLPFEETYRDTCILLGAPLARGPRESRIKQLLTPLEIAMDGTIELDKSGRFYLHRNSGGSMEMHLVAEGMRKLAMIARLIATGALLDNGYLFWDEPEANLNPRIMRTVAKTILQVAANDIQVFIATHSLFLLRELYILQQQDFPSLDTRCFGLHPSSEAAVTVQQGNTIDDIGAISALDEDLQQSDRYIDIEIGVGAGASDSTGQEGH